MQYRKLFVTIVFFLLTTFLLWNLFSFGDFNWMYLVWFHTLLHTYSHIYLVWLYTILYVLDLFFILKFCYSEHNSVIYQNILVLNKTGNKNLNPNSDFFITVGYGNSMFSLTFWNLILSKCWIPWVHVYIKNIFPRISVIFHIPMNLVIPY